MNIRYSIFNISFLNVHRQIYMGIAMLLVILYHAYCAFGLPFVAFKYGYIGVDIFLFLGSIGLCYSYEKNDVKTFYQNRIKRIYPLFALFALLATITIWAFKGDIVRNSAYAYYTY